MQSSKNRTDFCPLMEIASKKEGSCCPSFSSFQSYFAAEKINIRGSDKIPIDFSVRIFRKNGFGKYLEQVFSGGTRVIDNRVAHQHVRSQHFDQKALIGLVIWEKEVGVKQVA